MSWNRVVTNAHCDSDGQPSLTASAIKGVRTALDIPERELKRWRRIFDTNAKVVNGEKFLDPDSFVNAIAPKEDLSKIGRAQFAILFRVADASRRGLLSWTDFTVFQTLLKRPDADYWMAFQYFDVDNSGFITYDEFKSVFSANIGPDAIPFDFDCDWVKLYLGKKNGTHVLGCLSPQPFLTRSSGRAPSSSFQVSRRGSGWVHPSRAIQTHNSRNCWP